MVRFRDRRRSITTFSQSSQEQKEDGENRYVSIGRIDRSSYPKLRAWGFIIMFFLGLLYFLSKILFNY